MALLLIAGPEFTDEVRAQILEVFIEKRRSRHIDPTSTSPRDPVIKERVGTNWDTLELELGEVLSRHSTSALSA